ncbi:MULTISPECIES: CPBP family intramembrane glutamic endopeptidase [unclassified Tolypothrix]|uniref:CPBP family intramembrane glutamic endopeptidase n=1 Tax=unclassified Tolypothrix TaxID=2649714 RepID=UPI0005EAAA9E|nr:MULTISPECIES: type II CAAX endopeptidase family protein [unclassified Tolypothrix]BAY91396.1 abortive infection protein [Microchaete diplosiphon NIES-3275]EKF04474.1 CAAX amino terminal protease family protein [Tolypothrix sp. PCC 7601]MBE9080918.1 CPBP family intramembrane metalloprotease [Tolypothrix sp. LEGE 11397]UYD25445.1 CPBP family intramembrane metalloprotease [Tolypothrix sp. PCC 7712]UYD32310.1 CPBP family intramembrane metalloprotease [Tolypothrix sp. PCC 7601]
MRIKATKGKQGIGTEVKDATYVEAARWGKYREWRYVLGLVVILFSWLVIGSLASVFVAFALSGQPDYSVLDPFGKFLFVMAGFPFFLAGVLIAVTLIHRRHPRTLITAREKISWRRVGHGFVAWFVPFCLIGGLGQYFFYPDTFSFNSDLTTFVRFVPIALVLTAIQTTTEELFFRGYIVQGASIVWTNRIFVAIVPAAIFTLPHLLNPEAIAGGWLTVFFTYFLVPGLVWTVVSLVDGTTELAIGVHFANNIGGILLINITGSAMTTPALFTVSEYHATYGALSVLVAIPVFLAIAYKVFKRDEASEPVSQSHHKGRR